MFDFLFDCISDFAFTAANAVENVVSRAVDTVEYGIDYAATSVVSAIPEKKKVEIKLQPKEQDPTPKKEEPIVIKPGPKIDDPKQEQPKVEPELTTVDAPEEPVVEEKQQEVADPMDLSSYVVDENEDDTPESEDQFDRQIEKFMNK